MILDFPKIHGAETNWAQHSSRAWFCGGEKVAKIQRGFKKCNSIPCFFWYPHLGWVWSSGEEGPFPLKGINKCSTTAACNQLNIITTIWRMLKHPVLQHTIMIYITNIELPTHLWNCVWKGQIAKKCGRYPLRLLDLRYYQYCAVQGSLDVQYPQK